MEIDFRDSSHLHVFHDFLKELYTETTYCTAKVRSFDD